MSNPSVKSAVRPSLGYRSARISFSNVQTNNANRNPTQLPRPTNTSSDRQRVKRTLKSCKMPSSSVLHDAFHLQITGSSRSKTQWQIRAPKPPSLPPGFLKKELEHRLRRPERESLAASKTNPTETPSCNQRCRILLGFICDMCSSRARVQETLIELQRHGWLYLDSTEVWMLWINQAVVIDACYRRWNQQNTTRLARKPIIPNHTS